MAGGVGCAAPAGSVVSPISMRSFAAGRGVGERAVEGRVEAGAGGLLDAVGGGVGGGGGRARGGGRGEQDQAASEHEAALREPAGRMGGRPSSSAGAHSPRRQVATLRHSTRRIGTARHSKLSSITRYSPPSAVDADDLAEATELRARAVVVLEVHGHFAGARERVFVGRGP